MMGTDISKFKRMYRERNEGEFPGILRLTFRKECDLKYGENPNQHGAIYVAGYCRSIAELTNIVSVRADGKGKGGLSLTNLMDITRAMDVLKYFLIPSVTIMKHAIVSGFATGNKPKRCLTDLFRLARDADRRSNFGGTLVSNNPLNKETAEAMYEIDGFFVDVVAMPGYDEGVVGYLQGKSSNIRIAEFSALDKLPKFVGDETHELMSVKELPSGRIAVQDVYLSSIRGQRDWVADPMVVGNDGVERVVQRQPYDREVDDLFTSWYLNISGARSNGIVVVRDGVSVSIGSGQVERVGAVEQAIVKGIQKAMDREGIKYNSLYGIAGFEQLKDNPFNGAVCSSDAFFPFRDSVDLLGRLGVSAIIQPFGSLRDAEVIDAANEYKMAMVATGERCFGHF